MPMLLLALFFGGLLPFAFAPFSWSPLAFISLTGFFVLLVRTPEARIFKCCLLFFLGYFGIGVSWVQVSIHQFGLPVFAFSAAMTVLFVLVVALVPTLLFFMANRFLRYTLRFNLLLLFPAVWMLSEWVRSWLFTGFPWLAVGYSQIDSPLGGYATVLGTYGTSWIVALLAGVLAVMILQGRAALRLAALIGLPVIVLAVWLQQVSWTSPKGAPFSIAMVQANVAQAIKWLPEQRQKTLDQYREMSEALWAEADVIVWPETALPAFAQEILPYLGEVRQKAIETQTDILIGLPTAATEGDAYFNSVISLGALKDKDMDVYHKRHLVPFGEYLPLRALLDPILDFLQIPMSNFSSGEAEKALIATSRHQVGISICYEDVFGEEVISGLPEADYLVNVSNDAWFGDSFAPHQHLEMARMRALETGREMIRATNTGISAVVDHKGKLRDQIPQFESAVLVSSLQAYQGTTPYAYLGNLPVVIFALGLLMLLWFRRRSDQAFSRKR